MFAPLEGLILELKGLFLPELSRLDLLELYKFLLLLGSVIILLVTDLYLLDASLQVLEDQLLGEGGRLLVLMLHHLVARGQV